MCLQTYGQLYFLYGYVPDVILPGLLPGQRRSHSHWTDCLTEHHLVGHTALVMSCNLLSRFTLTNVICRLLAFSVRVSYVLR